MMRQFQRSAYNESELQSTEIQANKIDSSLDLSPKSQNAVEQEKSCFQIEQPTKGHDQCTSSEPCQPSNWGCSASAIGRSHHQWY
eukprot:scaffold693032_cov425-Attheya_sp.AAC.1